MTSEKQTLLSVDRLSVSFRGDDGPVAAVQRVSFDLHKGETLCLVGESGSGKSVTCLTMMGLLPYGAVHTVSGRILMDGRDLLTLPPSGVRALRGGDLAMIFQDPLGALNPVHTVGWQISEMLTLHGTSGRDARKQALELLRTVGIPDPKRRFGEYPHQLSGGMCQRAMIALAIAARPRILIADEPTTALDVTIQAQILDLLRDLTSRFDMSLLLITHDLGVVAEMADRVVVMRHGEVVETGAVDDIFHAPQHSYTRALLAAIPGRRAAA